MNELILSEMQLPGEIETLAQYDTMLSARQPVYRRLLKGVKDWQEATAEEKRILKRAQDEADYLIEIRVKMGEITAEIEKATAGRPSKNPTNNGGILRTKHEQLTELGISDGQASRFETLARPENRDVIEQVKAQAREENKLVTQKQILDAIKKPHVFFNSGNNEWYTPGEIIEAAREAMGSIDLDPASSDIAQKVVKAGTYYTAETDGLCKSWSGNVWMNPPYSTNLIGAFIDKLITERENINQAVVLVNNATETEWFTKLISIASAVVFPKGRIKFYMPDGKTGSPLQGQAAVYTGNNAGGFIKAFSGIGWGCMVWNTPTPTEG